MRKYLLDVVIVVIVFVIVTILCPLVVTLGCQWQIIHQC